MDDNSFWLKLWGVVAGAVMVFVVALCVYQYFSNVKMMELGYCQKTYPGANSWYLVKCEGE